MNINKELKRIERAERKVVNYHNLTSKVEDYGLLEGKTLKSIEELSKR